MPVETQKRVMVDIELQAKRTKLAASKLLKLYGISRSTFYGWSGEELVGSRHRRNLLTLLPEEEKAIVEYRRFHRRVGYRKFTWLMNDADVVALPESAIYKVLKKHDLLHPPQPNGTPANKEYEHKPTTVHEHWHIDIAYIKVRGIFYFLVMMLDGYSRYILDWELMPDMLGRSVEDFVVRARERYPLCTPKLITDNGSQFISRDFKRLVSNLDIQQVHTRRNHPQTNGKIERLNGTVKHEGIYPRSPASFEEARAVIGDFVLVYNNQRLHTSINFLRPVDMFLGRDKQILEQRKLRLAAAKAARLHSNKLNFKGGSTKISDNQFVRL